MMFRRICHYKIEGDRKHGSAYFGIFDRLLRRIVQLFTRLKHHHMNFLSINRAYNLISRPIFPKGAESAHQPVGS